MQNKLINASLSCFLLLEESIKNELLSKLDRISKENKNEPLYNSFVRWVCEHYLEIDNADDIDETINGIIEVGGKNDYGTDFFHFHEGKDDDESFMVWGQVKPVLLQLYQKG